MTPRTSHALEGVEEDFPLPLFGSQEVFWGKKHMALASGCIRGGGR